MVQTNMCNGPIYFNCSPNFSIDLTDPMILNTMILDVQIQGDEFHKCTNFAVIYRLSFRLMTSQINPKFNRKISPKNETILLQVDAASPSTFTPKTLKWNEITIPEFFITNNEQIPRNLEQREVNQIIEEPDGKITIKFKTSKPDHISSSSTARHSFSGHSSINFKEPIEQTNPNHPKYHFKNPVPEFHNFSSPSSPTRSDMINVIISKEKFKPDFDYLKTEKNNVYHQSDKTWFIQLDYQIREKIYDNWILEMVMNIIVATG